MRIWTIVWLVLLGIAPALVPTLARDFHRANGNEPGTLDPQLYELLSENNILRDMFEGLTTQGPDNRIVPGQAESWTMSDDGLTWTFRLRDGLVWSDGTPLTADDFVLGARRLADPKSAAKIPDGVLNIVNGRAILEGKMAPETLGIAAPDARTVVVSLAAPSPRVPTLMSITTFAPVPSALYARVGAAWVKPENIVTNGAYTLEEWRPATFVRLRKNTRYRDAAAVRIERVEFFPSDDQEMALKRFRAGELDVVGQLPPAKIGWAKQNLPEALHLSPVNQIRYIAINHRLPLLQDRRVRLALALAIDRETIAGQIMQGTALPAYGIIPRSIPGYGGAEFTFKGEPQAARVAKARALLAEAGYTASNPLALELRTMSDGWARPVAVSVAAMWKAIGVQVSIKSAEGNTHFAALKSGDYQVAMSGWFANDDPEEFMWLFQRDGGVNESKYANDAFDALRRDADRTTDLAARYARYTEAERLLLDDVAALPLFWAIQPALISPDLTGFAITPTGLTRSLYAGFGR